MTESDLNELAAMFLSLDGHGGHCITLLIVYCEQIKVIVKLWVSGRTEQSIQTDMIYGPARHRTDASNGFSPAVPPYHSSTHKMLNLTNIQSTLHSPEST